MTDVKIPSNQQEEEDDLIGTIDFRDAVVVNADWTIETINGQIEKGNIDLQPQFQRRAAWDAVRKSRLVESIIVGMPVPNIVLAENKEQRGKFIVIDGKQRLVSISEFFSNSYALKGLDIRSDLNGKTYDQLSNEDKDNFDNSTLRSTVIKNWKDENFLYAIFFRLNSGSLPLSPQELRKALTGGNLIDHIEAYLVRSDEFKALFGLELDKRMRDSELVLRFIAFDRFLEGYDGNFKRFLDETTKYFESDWNNRVNEVNSSLDRLDTSLRTSRIIFGSNAFKKWIGGKYERVMNRAIFDCIARFFADQLVVDHSLVTQDSVEEAFKKICDVERFKQAIERTTKSKDATFYRIDSWGESLAATIGRNYNSNSKRIE